MSKVLEGLNTWLQPMRDASGPDVGGGETPEKPPEAPTPVGASVRLHSGAIVGIFILLVFYFLYFASPILIPIIAALLLNLPTVRDGFGPVSDRVSSGCGVGPITERYQSVHGAGGSSLAMSL